MTATPLPPPWSDWAVIVREMPCAEMLIPDARLICLHPSIIGDPIAHAVAHLELGHAEAGRILSEDDERWALQMAYFLGDDEAA